MKTRWPYLLLFAALMAAPLVAQSKSSAPPHAVPYQNAKLGFKLKYLSSFRKLPKPPADKSKVEKLAPILSLGKTRAKIGFTVNVWAVNKACEETMFKYNPVAPKSEPFKTWQESRILAGVPWDRYHRSQSGPDFSERFAGYSASHGGGCWALEMGMRTTKPKEPEKLTEEQRKKKADKRLAEIDKAVTEFYDVLNSFSFTK
jgi:hypothetical protein